MDTVFVLTVCFFGVFLVANLRDGTGGVRLARHDAADVSMQGKKAALEMLRCIESYG
ncbi:hypothetical protein OE766_02585 [Pararhizobium sp. YC-54]|uniref:hypothetical protein n=1 Tax=Pararhizobium sp. YC-54 TaxID=2986920 RepID=UPI0021F69DD1|nr:hypothetical protein [Pararhizobium sp. YC-54]MCV9997126.1 hypothetical protein [Pararhizobium sp. YC-54]